MRAEYHFKAINCFVQCLEYDKIVRYASSIGLKMDDASMLSQLLFSKSQGALYLKKGLVNAKGGPLIDSKLGKSQLVQK